MDCPNCRAAIADDARFCPACGKEAVPTQTTATLSPISAPVRDLAGREIAGRYRILQKLGEGGMGAVYRGEQMSLKRVVAVKVLRAEMSANAMLLRRFNAEAEAVAKLGHPNTVHIYDFGQDVDGSLFIAMEFIEGRSLRAVMQAEAPFAPARALRIASQIAASIADAHAHGIVHRDLKPDNVMLQTRGREVDVVRVLDFGIAKLRDDSRATQQAMTQAGDMLGTPQYMAPEQIKGAPVDGRADIYSLGCLLYEMLTARLPFEATTVMAMLSKHLLDAVVAPSVRRTDLPITPDLDRLVLTAMMKEPAARPTTMDEYGEHIATALAAIPSALRATGAGATPSTQQVAVAAVAVAPTPTPAGMQYAATAAPPVAQTDPVRNVASTNSAGSARGLLYLVGLAALVIGGIGIVAWRSSSHATAKPNEASSFGSSEASAGEPASGSGSTEMLPASQDPWSGTKAGSGGFDGSAIPPPITQPVPVPQPVPLSAVMAPLPTREMPMPAGVHLSIPSGFRQQPDPIKHTLLYFNAITGVTIGCAPLVAGTNDATQLAHHWERVTGAKLQSVSKIWSHGSMRDALSFTTTFNNVAVGQIIVLYVEPSYRLGLLVQAPASMFNDSQFKAWAQDFYSNGVALP